MARRLPPQQRPRLPSHQIRNQFPQLEQAQVLLLVSEQERVQVLAQVQVLEQAPGLERAQALQLASDTQGQRKSDQQPRQKRRRQFFSASALRAFARHCARSLQRRHRSPTDPYSDCSKQVQRPLHRRAARNGSALDACPRQVRRRSASQGETAQSSAPAPKACRQKIPQTVHR